MGPQRWKNVFWKLQMICNQVRKVKKIASHFQFFSVGVQNRPLEKNWIFSLFLAPRPLKMTFFFFFFKLKLVAKFGSKKTSIKNLMYLHFWGQDIHLSEFLEKYPKNTTNWNFSHNFFEYLCYFYKIFVN